jgi:hypothetical protein
MERYQMAQITTLLTMFASSPMPIAIAIASLY